MNEQLKNNLNHDIIDIDQMINRSPRVNRNLQKEEYFTSGVNKSRT